MTRLAFEPRVALRSIEAFLKPEVEAGRLEVFQRTKAAAVSVQD